MTSSGLVNIRPPLTLTTYRLGSSENYGRAVAAPCPECFRSISRGARRWNGSMLASAPDDRGVAEPVVEPASVLVPDQRRDEQEQQHGTGHGLHRGHRCRAVDP